MMLHIWLDQHSSYIVAWSKSSRTSMREKRASWQVVLLPHLKGRDLMLMAYVQLEHLSVNFVNTYFEEANRMGK